MDYFDYMHKMAELEAAKTPGQQLFVVKRLSEVTGKWGAYDDDRSGPYRTLQLAESCQLWAAKHSHRVIIQYTEGNPESAFVVAQRVPEADFPINLAPSIVARP